MRGPLLVMLKSCDYGNLFSLVRGPTPFCENILLRAQLLGQYIWYNYVFVIDADVKG